MAKKAFRIESLAADMGLVTFDTPGEKVNKLSSAVMTELEEVIQHIQSHGEWKGVIFTSAKPGIFIAGADINEILSVTDPLLGQQFGALGQNILQRMADLPMVTVAAISGACMGGGLEFAMACGFRVVAENPKTRLGLPETKLGIIPGFGGTQRLPGLVGLPKALEMITTGNDLKAQQAYRAGLADDWAYDGNLLEKAEALIRDVLANGDKKYKKRRGSKGALGYVENLPGVRGKIFSKARAEVMKQSKGRYPALLAALEAIQASPGLFASQSGYAVEARLLGEMVATPESKNLIHLFFLMEANKKDTGLPRGVAIPAAVIPRSLGQLGAGTMGGGIAWLAASRGLEVRLKDINDKAVQKGVSHAAKLSGKAVERKKMKPEEQAHAMHRIHPSLDDRGFAGMDIVVEAVVEDMAIKQAVLRNVEAVLRPDALLVSNTSSISITEMAKSLEHPERFAGLHFFNPVDKMPLVEVVIGEQTSAETVVSLMQFARSLGKTPVPVKDGPGFLVNRLLMPPMNEAVRMLQEGAATVEQMDKLFANFGMPMGPFTLADVVGIDVCAKVIHILHQGLGARYEAPTLLDAIYDLQWLGNKSGKGFYVGADKERTINPELAGLIAQTQSKLGISSAPISDADILDRLLLPMINEAARCLADGIITEAGHVDLALIFGAGFPPFRGGLLKYADDRGISAIVARLRELEGKYGQRFSPCEHLELMARNEQGFYRNQG